jgi:hypothetical protein
VIEINVFCGDIVCGDISYIKLNAAVVPRAGEEIVIRKNLVPEHYFESTPPITVNEEEEVTFTVKKVRHHMAEKDHFIAVDCDVA